MGFTFEQQISRLMGKPLRRDPGIAQLKAGMWLRYAIDLCGSTQEFTDIIENTGTRSGLVRKWLAGGVRPTRQSALAFDRVRKGALWVFDLPLADLLDTRPTSTKVVARLMAPYTSPIALTRWWFPGDEELLAQRQVPKAVLRGDSQGLYSRGDIYGLTGIIAVIRETELAGNDGAHLLACADAYRILPAVYRAKWVRHHSALLEEALERLRARKLHSLLLFDVDWDVIRRQTDDPTFTTHREMRARDPLTGRHCEPEDPITFAEIVPGAKVKRHAKQRAERRERRSKK